MNLCSAGCVDRRAGKARHREIACLAPRGWNDLGAQFSVGREDAMKADEMEFWARDKRGQALHELQG